MSTPRNRRTPVQRLDAVRLAVLTAPLTDDTVYRVSAALDGLTPADVAADPRLLLAVLDIAVTATDRWRRGGGRPSVAALRTECDAAGVTTAEVMAEVQRILEEGEVRP